MFSLLSLLERLSLKKKQAQDLNSTSFVQLVADVSDGVETDDDAILLALEQFGKTPQDLDAAIQLLARRRELQREIQEAAKGEREIPEMEKRLKEASDILEAAKKAFEETGMPLHWGIQSRRQASSQSFSCTLELMRTAGGPAAQNANEIRSRLNELHRQVQLREASVEYEQKELERRKLELKNLPRPVIRDDNREDYENSVRRLELRVASQEKSVADANQQLTDAKNLVEVSEADLKAAELLLLEPTAI